MGERALRDVEKSTMRSILGTCGNVCDILCACNMGILREAPKERKESKWTRRGKNANTGGKKREVSGNVLMLLISKNYLCSLCLFT